MYQDIPAKEFGSTNNKFYFFYFVFFQVFFYFIVIIYFIICYGIPYKNFKEYLQKEINRKNNKVTSEDTPTITYIMYVDNNPVGTICLRTQIDENWKKWSGNFYYKIRKSERNKGYGTEILKLALKKFKSLGFKEVYGQSSKGNIASAKVIENNGGILINENNGTRYYKIKI